MKLQLCAVALLVRNIAAVRLGDEDDGLIQAGGGSTTAAAAGASTTAAVASTTAAVASTTASGASTTGAIAPTTGAVAPTTGALAPTTGAVAPTTGAVAPTTGAGTATAAPTTSAPETTGTPCTSGKSSASGQKVADLPTNVSKAGALEEVRKTDDVNDKKGDDVNDKDDNKKAGEVNDGDDKDGGIMTEEAIKKEDEELKGWLKENLKDVLPEKNCNDTNSTQNNSNDTNSTQNKSADGNSTKWGYIGTDCMMQRQRMAARKVLESGCSQVFEFGGYLAPLDKLLKERDYNPKDGDVLKDTTKLNVKLPKKFINVDELFPEGSVQQEDGMKVVNLPFSMEALFKNKTTSLVTEHGVDFKEPTCGVFVGMYTPYYSAEYDKEAMSGWWKMFMDVKLVVVDTTSYSEDFVDEVFMPSDSKKSFGVDKSVEVDCSAVLSKKPYEMKASAAKRTVKFVKPGRGLANVPFKLLTGKKDSEKSGQNVGPEDNTIVVRLGIGVLVLILVAFGVKFMWARQRAAERAAEAFYGGYESEDSD